MRFRVGEVPLYLRSVSTLNQLFAFPLALVSSVSAAGPTLISMSTGFFGVLLRF